MSKQSNGLNEFYELNTFANMIYSVIKKNSRIFNSVKIGKATLFF
jgi:hypothetical protein